MTGPPAVTRDLSSDTTMASPFKVAKWSTAGPPSAAEPSCPTSRVSCPALRLGQPASLNVRPLADRLHGGDRVLEAVEVEEERIRAQAGEDLHLAVGAREARCGAGVAGDVLARSPPTARSSATSSNVAMTSTLLVAAPKAAPLDVWKTYCTVSSNCAPCGRGRDRRSSRGRRCCRPSR